VTFVIAFVVVLVLIGATAWLVRRFGAGRLEAAGRGRQPRLAVIDTATVDGRRKLLIIRRDNVEHLLMIGGPTDVVVETNIVRTGATNQREVQPARGGVADTLPRAVPLPDATPWPPPLEPTPVARLERPRISEEPILRPTQPEPAPRQQRPIEPLAGLAADLARPNQETPRHFDLPRVPASSPTPQSEPSAAPISPSVAPAATAPVADANLADMAHRLETALRRPVPQSGQTTKHETMAPRVELKVEPPKGAPPKEVYDNLEKEMASLLGRQPGKT
jgi:hypothetical protein